MQHAFKDVDTKTTMSQAMQDMLASEARQDNQDG